VAGAYQKLTNMPECVGLLRFNSAHLMLTSVSPSAHSVLTSVSPSAHIMYRLLLSFSKGVCLRPCQHLLIYKSRFGRKLSKHNLHVLYCGEFIVQTETRSYKPERSFVAIKHIGIRRSRSCKTIINFVRNDSRSSSSKSDRIRSDRGRIGLEVILPSGDPSLPILGKRCGKKVSQPIPIHACSSSSHVEIRDDDSVVGMTGYGASCLVRSQVGQHIGIAEEGLLQANRPHYDRCRVGF
jgi:hypothetical protein